MKKFQIKNMVVKAVAAALVAAFVATTPMVLDTLADTELTPAAMAGRLQSGTGEG